MSPLRRRLAMIVLAASEGWYGSQKTYFDLSEQTLERGPHGIRPPNLPATWQQAESALSKPVMKSKKRFQFSKQSPKLPSFQLL